MRRFAIVCLFVLLTAGLSFAKEFEVNKKVGDFSVAVKIDRNPPVVGNNNMEIGIKDGGGKSVTDAKVAVDYTMPAMPGMPAMNYKTDASLKGDVYKATMNLSMPGSWNIDVKITRAGKTQTMKFTVDAK